MENIIYTWLDEPNHNFTYRNIDNDLCDNYNSNMHIN